MTWTTPVAKLSRVASKQYGFSIIGDEFIQHYQLKKGFYGLSDIPTVFQEHIDKGLEWKTTVWPGLLKIMNGNYGNRIQNEGCIASKKKTELLKSELTWLGFVID